MSQSPFLSELASRAVLAQQYAMQNNDIEILTETNLTSASEELLIQDMGDATYPAQVWGSDDVPMVVHRMAAAGAASLWGYAARMTAVGEVETLIVRQLAKHGGCEYLAIDGQVGGWTMAKSAPHFTSAVLGCGGHRFSVGEPAFSRAREALTKAEQLQPNWNGRGGVRPSSGAIRQARRFLALLPRYFPAPAVEPSGDGEVNFVWRRGADYVEFGLYDEGAASYFARVGGKETLEDLVAPLVRLPDGLRVALEAFSDGGL